MSTTKTRSEMAAALEFIQYLERLRSGSLTGNVGVNRSLERLAENFNAVIDSLQEARMKQIQGGGAVLWDSGTGQLSWSADIVFHFPNEVEGAVNNTLASSDSPVSFSADGEVAYIIFDRTTNAVVAAPIVVSNMATFLTTILGAANRLDYYIIAQRQGASVNFLGHKLRSGMAWSNSFYTDGQYGQQTEVTLVHNNLNEDRKFILTSGGNLTWDASSTTFSWSSDLIIEFPSSAGNNRLSTGSAVIPVGNVLYVTLTRTPGVSTIVSPTVTALGSVPTTDNILVLAIHKADGRLYLWNGQAFSDGETLLLGGVRSGVQWYYMLPGSGVQLIDFTQGGTYPDREYFVGSHSLMLYRNGVKAKKSTAFWSGSYPIGSLVGAISSDDEYVEEDTLGDGVGTRVIWLQDGQVAAEPLYHVALTHDPVWTWPSASDNIEAFIGILGQGPSPVESLGILGDPGDPVEGDIFLEEGTGISLTYDVPNNAIIISLSTSAFTSLEVSGGSEGAQMGPLLLTPTASIAPSDATAPGELSFNIEEDYIAPLEGFEIVWSGEVLASRTIYTVGGILRHDGEKYISSQVSGVNGRVAIDSTLVYPAQSILNNAWNYLYLYPAVIPGEKPRGVFSSSVPTVHGRHPLNSAYKFLSSVFTTGGGKAQLFRKVGSWVSLLYAHDISSVFTPVATFDDSFATLALSGVLPATCPMLIKVRIEVAVNGGTVAVGAETELEGRLNSGADSFFAYAIRPASTTLARFELEIPLEAATLTFQLKKSSAWIGITSAYLLGYSEGRLSALAGMGS